MSGSGSNIGIGRFDPTSTVSSHQAGTPLVGYTYNGAGVAPATDTNVTPARCVAIASSIDTIYQEIIQLRKIEILFVEHLTRLKRISLRKN